ncbi:unnamed protein product [Rotaria socialis]|uniref:RanBD1 domain-containing protein n=1 Tax=Rotaria socialis TaxID=392032 RepID=A0A821JDK4_9BILA|nr:unnamed protein product [Rotaria socialis]CAF4716360.1 unnamed protein product [Rotaria socialis]
MKANGNQLKRFDKWQLIRGGNSRHASSHFVTNIDLKLKELTEQLVQCCKEEALIDTDIHVFFNQARIKLKQALQSPLDFKIEYDSTSFINKMRLKTQASLILSTTSINTIVKANNNEDDESHESNVIYKRIVQLSAVEVKTDEEDENVLFCERAKLYLFDSQTNQMKERGIGEMRILQHQTTNRLRILMRSMDFTEGEAKHQTLCVKFESNDIAKRLVKQFNEAKRTNANA